MRKGDIVNFSNDQVAKVSDFLQDYMTKNHIELLTPDDCAEILAMNNILPNTVGPKPGFNFRQMLRDGRDGLIDLVKGASQIRPRTRWTIKKVNNQSHQTQESI